MSQLQLDVTASLTALQGGAHELPTWAGVALATALGLILIGGGLIRLAGRVAALFRQVARIRADIAVGHALVTSVQTSTTNNARNRALKNYLRFRGRGGAEQGGEHDPAPN